MCDALEMVKLKVPFPNSEKYYLATIHRLYNTDDLGRLKHILSALNQLDKKVIMPPY